MSLQWEKTPYIRNNVQEMPVPAPEIAEIEEGIQKNTIRLMTWESPKSQKIADLSFHSFNSKNRI